MPIRNFCSCLAGLLFPVLIGSTPHASAAVLTSGNLLISNGSESTVREVDAAGMIVQTFAVEGVGNAVNVPRDLVVDSRGNIQIYNGVFEPVLSQIVSATGIQTNRSAEFSSRNVGGRGNIAAVGTSVFVTDENTSGSPDYGFLRFDDAGVTRFSSDFSANDLTVGQNGRLYSLGVTNNSTAGTPDEIREFDPSSLLQLSSLTLPSATSSLGFIGLVAATDGSFFGVTLSDFVYQLDATGAVINSLDLSATNPDLSDIDIDASGRLVIGSRFGEVFLTDTTLASFSSFDTGSRVYVAFTTPATAVPEPTTLAVLIGVGLLAVRKRNPFRSSTVSSVSI